MDLNVELWDSGGWYFWNVGVLPCFVFFAKFLGCVLLCLMSHSNYELGFFVGGFHWLASEFLTRSVVV